MAALGLDQELIDSRFPWICTLCGRCEYACPQGVEILKMMRRARGLRERDKVPGPIHKGVVMDLERGNNLGIPRDDFLFLLADLSKEMDEDEGVPGFYAPVDKKGANILVTINSKEPFGEPDDMKFWWRIFYAAREDWTIPSENWEGVNWGLFSGDDESMKNLGGPDCRPLGEAGVQDTPPTRMRPRIFCDQAWSADVVSRGFREIQSGFSS